MLVGIIKDKTNNIEYYIDSEKKDKYYEVGVTKVDNNGDRLLTREEVHDLLRTILSSKLTYKEKYYEYDVYLDEANNKRYFKNGIEDFFMFINNNGVDALNYIEKINKHQKPKSRYINVITSTIVFELILTTAALIPFAGDVQLRQKADTLVSSAITLDANELINSINSSTKLSDEDKKALANEDFLNFALEYSDPIRNYSFRQRFNDIGIKTFDITVLDNANGFYSVHDPNTIYILDTDLEANDYQDILIHEFIHMTQSKCPYYYIIEGSDELFKYEFYNKPVIAYPECVKRLKVLMEIIGPEPIADCNFKNDQGSFKKAIYQYLSPEEAEDLLKLFCTTARSINDPTKDDVNEEVNSKIDAYFAKMYYNKTGKDIKDDGMIRLIYNDNDKDRVYFNNKSENYDKDCFLFNDNEIVGEYDIQDIVSSNDVVSYEYNTKEIVIVDNRLINNAKRNKTTDFSTIQAENGLSVRISFNDGTVGYTTYLEKDGWSKVKQYRFFDRYEPAITKKFPNQARKVNKEYNKELDIMISEKEFENDKCEAKSI